MLYSKKQSKSTFEGGGACGGNLHVNVVSSRVNKWNYYHLYGQNCQEKYEHFDRTGGIVDASDDSLLMVCHYKFLPELIFLKPWKPPVPRMAFMSSSLVDNPLGATSPFLVAIFGCVFLSLGACGIS